MSPVYGDYEVTTKDRGMSLTNLLDIIGLLKHAVQIAAKNTHMRSLRDNYTKRNFSTLR